MRGLSSLSTGSSVSMIDGVADADGYKSSDH